MSPHLIALPALLLLAAALVPELPLRMSPGMRRWIPVSGATAAVVAALGLTAWLFPADRTVLSLSLSAWTGEGTVFQQEPRLVVDAAAALAMALIAISSLAAALRSMVEQPVAPWPSLGRDDALPSSGPLLVAATATLFVAATRAPIGLPLAWILLDLALTWRCGGRGGRRVLLGGQIGLFLALAGLTGAGTWALVAAGVVRAGLYPVAWSVPRSGGDHAWRALAVRLPATIAGLHLALTTGDVLARGAGVDRFVLAAGGLAVLVGAVRSYYARSRASGLDWGTSAHAGLVLVALGLADPVGRAISVFMLIDLVVARGTRYAADGLAPHRSVRLARWMGWWDRAALPVTLGFCARWLLYEELLIREAPATGLTLLVIVVAATLLGTSPRRVPGGRSALDRRQRIAVSPALVLGGAGIVLGMTFEWLAMLGPATGGSILRWPLPLSIAWPGVEQIQRAIGTPDVGLAQRIALLNVPITWLLILVPVGLGGLLDRVSSSADRARLAGDRIRRTLSLTPLFDAGLRMLVRTGEAAHVRSGLVEGRRSTAITLSGAVVVLVALLGGADRAGVDRWPDGGEWIRLIIVASIGGLILLGRAPGVLLGMLLLVDVIVGATLWALGVPPVVATIHVLTGFLAVAILAVTQWQAPTDRRLAAAARRLRRLRRTARGRGRRASEVRAVERTVQIIALVTAVVIAAGLRAPPAVPELSGAGLRLGIAIVSAGALTVLFAGSALHLATGVLAALSGFGLLYAAVDPGLAVAAAVAVIRLLFTLVASLFIGLPTPGGDQPADRAGTPSSSGGSAEQVERPTEARLETI